MLSLMFQREELDYGIKSIGAVNVHELIAVSHPYASRILQGYSGDVWSWNSNGCHEHDPVDRSYEDRRTTEGDG